MWLLVLLACAGAPDETDDTASCGDVETGTLRVCVFMSEGDEQGIADSTIYFREPGDELWTESRAGADGCGSVDLQAGTWEIQAVDDTGYCSSEVATVTVATCETTEHRFDVLMGCVDG